MEQLAVQVVAIRHHQQGRVIHFRLLQQLPGITTHRNTLTRALSMPHHTSLFAAGHHLIPVFCALFCHTFRVLCSNNRGFYCFSHSMELVITGYFFDDCSTVVFKKHKKADVIKQHLAVEKTPHQGFQLPFQQWLIIFIFYSTPG